MTIGVLIPDGFVHSLPDLWSLWHGNVYKAFQKITDLAMGLDVAVAITDDGTARKLLRAVEEFHTGKLLPHRRRDITGIYPL
jgi:hypothetical protein